MGFENGKQSKKMNKQFKNMSLLVCIDSRLIKKATSLILHFFLIDVALVLRRI